MRRGPVRTVLVALLIAVAAGAFLLFGVRPSIPANAAAAPVATATLEESRLAGERPSGHDCLPRIERDAGWIEVCWEAHGPRAAEDGDAHQDYSTLRLYGSYQSTSALGIRWLVLEARLRGTLSNNVMDGWPSGTYEGPCAPAPVSLAIPMDSVGTESLCGRTSAGPGEGGAAWRSEWTCGPCLPFDDTTRGFALYHLVAVPEGEVPSWDLFVDVGS